MIREYQPSIWQRTMERILDGSRRAIRTDWKTALADFRVRRIGNRRYVTENDAWCNTGLAGCAAQLTRQGESNPLIVLDQAGKIQIRKGFKYDGPSGPTFDTRDSMLGACVHDALYALHDLRKIPDEWRHRCDRLAVKIWLADGMYFWRAKAWGQALDKFAGLFWRS